MNTFRALFFALALGSSGFAQNVVTSLVPPSETIAPGSTVPIDFVVFNPGANEATFDSQLVLSGVIFANGRSWPIELTTTAPAPASVAANGFAVRRYDLKLPLGATGHVVVELTQNVPATTRAVVYVGDQGVASTSKRAVAPLSSIAAPTPAAAAITRAFAGRLAPHEPIYFIYGPDAPAVKFQISFKYKLFGLGGGGENSIPRSLEFGYTQRSLWDINGNSSPFYDTSYMPELFVESLGAAPGKNNGWFTWLGYQAGFKHESNGRDGSVSRSLNTVFFRPAFAFGSLDRWSLIVLPEFYGYIGGLSDNPDLKEYRGYGKLRLILGRSDGLALMFTGLAGKDFNHETVQLDLTIPVRNKFLDLQTYFLVQYFNGYGESLLSYNKSSETVRAGISFVR